MANGGTHMEFVCQRCYTLFNYLKDFEPRQIEKDLQFGCVHCGSLAFYTVIIPGLAERDFCDSMYTYTPNPPYPAPPKSSATETPADQV